MNQEIKDSPFERVLRKELAYAADVAREAYLMAVAGHYTPEEQETFFGRIKEEYLRRDYKPEFRQSTNHLIFQKLD